jgi:hypothetical protein
VARGGRVRATTSFVYEVKGEQVVVHAGDVFASTHAVVKTHPELFGTPEQATAAPGEVR